MRTKKYRPTNGSSTLGPLNSLSKDQLAWIGASCLAYNEAEEWLQIAFINCVRFPGRSRDLVDRISIGALPSLVFGAVERLRLDPKVIKLADMALRNEGFSQLKTYRDGVVHARMFDEGTAIGALSNKGTKEFVLLSDAALEGLYRRLEINSFEIMFLTEIISDSISLRHLRPGENDQHKSQLEESIQAATVRLDQPQKARKSLPPLPPFPKEFERAALAAHKKEGRSARKKPRD